MIGFRVSSSPVYGNEIWKSEIKKNDIGGISMKRIRLNELPIVTSPRGPKIRRVVSTDDVAVVNIILGPGQVLPSHKTPVDVLFYVHSGSGYVIIADDSIEVAAGDMVPSPKNIPHGLKAAEEDDFSVLVIKTPNPDAPKNNN
jgi:quercetin dioxygenase-like cupin family protein